MTASHLTTTVNTSVQYLLENAEVVRYEHGGARVYWMDSSGHRHLIADLHDDAKAEMREHIIGLLGLPVQP